MSQTLKINDTWPLKIVAILNPLQKYVNSIPVQANEQILQLKSVETVIFSILAFRVISFFYFLFDKL